MEREFLELLPLVDRVIAFVVRRHHVSSADADDFASAVKVRLIENDYAVLRKFEGRSSMKTFLTTVITRLFQDWRNTAWGKWRPSAEARRAGPVAVKLEELMARDGLAFEESVEVLQTNLGVRVTRAELETLAGRLPARVRRRFEPAETLEPVAGPDTADRQLLEGERRRLAERAQRTLQRVVTQLPPQDALILSLRFSDGRKVSEIAALMHLEQKPLYTRIDSLLARLRRELEADGVDASMISV